MYKKFSTFDGTDCLRYDYVFINLHSERSNTIMKQKFIRVKRERSKTLLRINNWSLKKSGKPDFKKSIFCQENYPNKDDEESHKKG